LLKRFGSLTRLREATPEEIAETPGIGPDLAASISERLHAQPTADRRATA
jgi:excinuclease ABC subunit C